MEEEIYKYFVNILTFFNRTDRDKKLIQAAGVKLEATSLQAFISIGRMQPTKVSDLANVLGKNHSSTSRQIDKLERNELVVTHNSKKDSRIREIYLSQKGEQIIKKINAARSETMQSAFDNWQEADKENLLSSLRHLSKTLDEIDDK
ncbi:MarR family winged helix-turn-helix transcriptional regulator [Companilactobacillus halodurans]|uniref:MarR family transcriptional regulator n=1 Tax=Companilactobacillus halodurans TaxID=2584183 RepID=A0A5P0ZY07_9LACO|nr:MarR family transcriptional regulator [Companilactobacillus halodurans]MQS75540.1 MarR family transcriptional regulator [Companilactobacillus halodurans]MQS97785.1 MarR family transcriptional regulator [Companilactobacillus halodurans]